jgi:hypothetical protein
MAPYKRELPAALKFIREALPEEGVNTLVLEFDFKFDYQSHPEFADHSALNADDARQIARACREKKITLIPMLNCLGHQSWAANTGRLLALHPEFDETAGKFPGNDGIYCRSYCPLYPGLHPLLFDLTDELARACEAKAFHVGMDEVFILADPDCPRCGGKNPAKLFAEEVRVLAAHFKAKGMKMWMWGDRFIDGKTTGLGKWEASGNGTQGAIDLAPKDVVICDWHYDAAPPTPELFVKKGFSVVACPWRKPAVALAEAGRIRAIHAAAGLFARHRALGVMQTVWSGFTPFVNAYYAER